MDIKYHQSCATLSIYNFYRIMDDGDLRFLVVGYDEIESEDINVTDEATNIFNSIIQEYSELTSNNEVVVNLNLQILIAELEFEKDTLQKILYLFNYSNNFKVLKLLSNFGFEIKEDDDINLELEKVIKRVKGLNNKIRINKSKYASRFKKVSEEIKRNLDKEALLLEMNLKLGREIDVHSTSVLKWVNMIDMSNERNAEAEKIRNK